MAASTVAPVSSARTASRPSSRVTCVPRARRAVRTAAAFSTKSIVLAIGFVACLLARLEEVARDRGGLERAGGLHDAAAGGVACPRGDRVEVGLDVGLLLRRGATRMSIS